MDLPLVSSLLHSTLNLISLPWYIRSYNMEDDLPLLGLLLPGRPGGGSMTWVYLIVAGVLEVVWAFAMKESDGFTRLIPTLITFSAMLISFYLLAIAMRSIPLGTAYVIWTGIGAVGAFLVGITILSEPVNALRIIAAVLIVSGLVLMKVASP